MKYIVLLRGINISGKNKIPMKELKNELDKSYKNVITYLNSGNVILDSEDDKLTITNNISSLIKRKFNLDIPIYVIDYLCLKDIIDNSPNWWGKEDKNIYDNIIFIIPPVSIKDVFNSIGEPSKDIDMVLDYGNVIFWSFDLKNYKKSNWWKKTATENIKDSITIRTANTSKKILDLCIGGE